MTSQPETLRCHTVGEWTLRSERTYANPFADVQVDATFTAAGREPLTAPGFYDGDGVWRVRFSPGRSGPWQYTISSRPHDPDLSGEGSFEALPREARGMLRATPGDAWGFRYQSGEPAFLLGDTVYNLFGAAHCGLDVESFLRRRAAQGFNLLRVRCQVSPFHPPDARSRWQTRSTWPWGGSEQSPQFDRFDLAYFHTVDGVVQLAAELGIGLEMIMEAWGFEFPFSNRSLFVPEWEELWLRHLIARYDAYSSVYFWTLMNEYEFYPNGDWRHAPVADRWAMRLGRWVKQVAPHGHVVSVHNGPQEPPFARRFAADPGAIDAVMFQCWGGTGEHNGWLADGIEEQIGRSLAGWAGSAVFAEYGYERNPDLPLTFPGFDHLSPEHTRRGAWRGAFCSLGVIAGFENTWGPVMILDEDQPGVGHLQHLRHFLCEVVPLERLRPAPELLEPGDYPPGHRPLALATGEGEVVAVYLPVGGDVTLSLPTGKPYSGQWYDPRTGALQEAGHGGGGSARRLSAPDGQDDAGHPWDWALVLSAG